MISFTNKIRSMFDSISHGYDLGNDICSFGLHRYWRKKLLALVEMKSPVAVMDICTGTGDLALRISEVASVSKVWAFDYSQGMLENAKASKLVSYFRADAQHIPVANSVVDLVSIGFGIRNIEDVDQALKECHRVLAQKGRILILEFGQSDSPIINYVFRIYSKYVMPLLGWVATGNFEAYRYLQSSSEKFPCGKNFCRILEKNGFRNVSQIQLFFGLAYIYQGDR